MFSCLICDKKFDSQKALNGHNTSVHSKHFRSHKVSCTKICPKCGNTFLIDRLLTKEGIKSLHGEKTFCSRKCANSHIQTAEANKKRSKALKGKKCLRKIGVHSHRKHKIKNEKKCEICGNIIYSRRKTCSKKCYIELQRKLGVQTASKVCKRSKNEIAFYDLCKNYFKNVDHNTPIFNGWDADIIIHDIKYAILWNGVWHYKKITKRHSLSQVQNRDKIKINEIIKCNYIPYTIKDLGGYNINFVKLQFDRFIEYFNTG